MRDSFVFYRSFFESFSDLSKKDKLALFDALCNYALNDVEPELTGAPSAMFKLLKPQVDANNRRYENGKKGGRPKGNQTETKTKPNNNQTKTKTKPNVNDNVNVNDNDNDNEHDNDNALGSSVSGGRYKVDDEFNLWKKLTPEDIDVLYEKFPNSGGLLIDEVFAEVKNKKVKVKSGLNYILGYAKNVGWDDNADHFDGGGLS